MDEDTILNNSYEIAKFLNLAALRFKMATSTLVTLMKPKDIFGLAVRGVGLYFLYLGLYGITQFLSSDLIETANKSDIFYALLPVAFNLIIAFCLLKAWFLVNLVRWAYPESPKLSEHLPAPSPPPQPPSPASAPAPALSGMEQAEKKLASLVEKPRGNP